MSFAANGQASSLSLPRFLMQIIGRLMEHIQHIFCAHRQPLPFLLGDASPRKGRNSDRTAERVVAQRVTPPEEECGIDIKNIGHPANHAYLDGIVLEQSEIDDLTDQ